MSGDSFRQNGVAFESCDLPFSTGVQNIGYAIELPKASDHSITTFVNYRKYCEIFSLNSWYFIHKINLEGYAKFGLTAFKYAINFEFF